MTSSPRPTTSRLWRFWNERPELALPLLFFAAMLAHGSLFGLTDDEAYYWVLAQRPSLGYAYHPPAVAWLIAASETLLGWIPRLFSQTPSVALVRLPGIACMALVLGLAIQWLKESGVPRARLRRAALVCVSFAGIFALSWMMVPDLPLMAGWTLAFLAAWRICFAPRAGLREEAMLFGGLALMLVSKYSAVLAAGSAGLSILLWAPRERRLRGALAAAGGVALGVLPALVWNARHDWASILWQIRDRHEGGGLSLLRYARFWAIELLVVGPGIVAFAFLLPVRAIDRRDSALPRFVALWLLPAALVFCVQPLWADFKPHWAFIAFWPAALALAHAFGSGWSSGRLRTLARAQIGYGLVLGALVTASCHLPIGTWVMAAFRGPGADPRLDVTNDLYGWGELREFVRREAGPGALGMPFVGSRYQTASQVAFALGHGARFTMLPTDLKSRDEWPDLGISLESGGSWPRLTAPVFFVTDNRYDAPPEFAGARCERFRRLEKTRLGLPAKWIELWKCLPEAG